jgi:CheY-like chemotaxis protein
VADDHQAVRQVIFDTLANADFDVDTVADGEEAWQAVQHHHYDLLVTDNDMPRLTGLDLSKRIRAVGMSLPILMASGSISEACAHDCANLQVAVVPKPFALRSFLNTVYNALLGSTEAPTGAKENFFKAPAPRSQPQARAARPSHNHVLIVDDDQTVRGSLAAVLESEGFKVDEAGSGVEAVHWATHQQFDLVLLDLNMPRGDGWTAFRQLDQVAPLLPVIVITARPNQYPEAVRAGVDAFMEKPLNIPVLVRAIQRLTNEDEAHHVSRITNRAFVTKYLGSTDSGHPQFSENRHSDRISH